MKTLHPLSIFVILLATITATYAATYAAAPGPASTTVSGDTDFIRISCETTLYPEMCYHSLAGYANNVQQDPARLARVAIGISLSRARHVTVYVANLSRQADYGADHRAAAALHDCFSVFGDAVDQIRGSLKQMRSLRGSGETLRFEMSNVQTWMSAALTNEDTCMDGFEDVPDEPIKVEVFGRVLKVKEVTSNALALVNSYVDRIVGP